MITRRLFPANVFLAGLLLPILVAAFSSQLPAQAPSKTQLHNWHQWRGPDANGVSRSANPPTEWSE